MVEKALGWIRQLTELGLAIIASPNSVRLRIQPNALSII